MFLANWVSFLALVLSFYSSLAYARFYHWDADEVDREDRLGVEFYNDIYGYLDPLSWEEIFQKSQLAYRAWAGSLNMNNSYVLEDVKLLTSKVPDPVQLQFTQHREEGLVEQKFFQELRIQFNGPWGLYIAPLVEARSFKKWDDFGLALGLQKEETKRIEFFVWNVDHYYNTKEDNDGDRYKSPIYSYGGKVEWSFLKDAKLTASGYYDTPLTWDRKSKFYVYKNTKTFFDIGVQSPSWNAYQVWAKTNQEIKKEEKTWPALNARKALVRRVGEYLVGVQRIKEEHTTQVYFGFFQRKADYENANLKEPDTEIPTNSIRHHEWMLACTYNHPFFSNFFQWGLFYNNVRRANPDLEKTQELKLQTALEVRIHKHGFVFLNATWDIDQIIRKPSKPWGGGGLNFMIAF